MFRLSPTVLPVQKDGTELQKLNLNREEEVSVRETEIVLLPKNKIYGIKMHDKYFVIIQWWPT